MTTMRWAEARWVGGCPEAVFSLAGALPAMRTSRLSIFVWFMAVPVRARANQVALSVYGWPDRVSRSHWPGWEEIVVSAKKDSRNAPCPCGSGKKYKHCCYGKGIEDG